MNLAALAANVRERPVAVALRVGSLTISLVLLLGVVVAVASGLPGYPGGIWLAVAVVGAGFATFWTVCLPLYERLRVRRASTDD